MELRPWRGSPRQGRKNRQKWEMDETDQEDEMGEIDETAVIFMTPGCPAKGGAWAITLK